jgi:hypothetical protein
LLAAAAAAAAAGEMIKAIRTQHMADATNSNKVASMIADNFALLNNTMPKVLNVVNAAHKVRGMRCWRETDSCHPGASSTAAQTEVQSNSSSGNSSCCAVAAQPVRGTVLVTAAAPSSGRSV